MKINPTKIDKNMTTEQAILYYLFVDEQLICAWWDYLEYWNEYQLVKDTVYEDSEFVNKQKEVMQAVDYWESILDQLKEIVTFDDIEDYLNENPEIRKNYLFIKT